MPAAPDSQRAPRVPQGCRRRGEDGAGYGAYYAEVLSRTLTGVAPEPGVRWAALLADVAAPRAVARMRSLRSPNVLIKAIRGHLSALSSLRSPPEDAPGVRRLAHSCPVPVDGAVVFARAAAAARNEPTEAIDRFSALVADLRRREDLGKVTPALNGAEVMELLGLHSGPRVGRALALLRELAFERGPISRQTAAAALLDWADRNWARSQPPVTARLRGARLEAVRWLRSRS